VQISPYRNARDGLGLQTTQDVHKMAIYFALASNNKENLS